MDSPPGMISASSPVEIVDGADLARADPEAREGLRVRLEPALEGENADRHQPRCWSSPPFSWSVPISMPGMASPSSREAAAMRSGSL